MASSISIPAATTNSVSVSNPLAGDGTSGDPLALSLGSALALSGGGAVDVQVDSLTTDVNGSNQVEVIGAVDPFTIAGSIVGTEIAAPSAPAANGFVIYAADNGGKTELLAKFNTGAAQRIAIQP